MNNVWCIKRIPCRVLWLTADVPPPPRTNSLLSENVRIIVSRNGTICTTTALYSYATTRWVVAGGGRPLYWQEKEPASANSLALSTLRQQPAEGN